MSDKRMTYDICDDCTKWALGCELDGEARRHCIEKDYEYFKPKKIGVILDGNI